MEILFLVFSLACMLAGMFFNSDTLVIVGSVSALGYVIGDAIRRGKDE